METVFILWHTITRFSKNLTVADTYCLHLAYNVLCYSCGARLLAAFDSNFELS